jgi:cobalt/nickel transport system permease protein
LDARVKVIFTLAFLVCINLSPSGAWPAYILFLTLLICEALLSRISLRVVLLRSLISLPFILAAFPLLFTGTAPKFLLFSTSSRELMISQPGLIHFLSITIKSWLSILAAIMLTCTTRFQDLLLAFRQLGIQKTLVAILSLMWRYLSLIIDEALNLMRARNSRSGALDRKQKIGGSLCWRGKVTGKMTGNLLIRSLERSERVYVAMASRGYNGEIPVPAIKKFNTKDYFLMTVCVLISIVNLMIAKLFH